MLVHFFYVMSGFEERNLNSKIHLKKSLKKLLENKKEKAFLSPPSFFSAILAQTPRPFLGHGPAGSPSLPPLYLWRLTGGAHSSGSSPSAKLPARFPLALG